MTPKNTVEELQSYQPVDYSKDKPDINRALDNLGKNIENTLEKLVEKFEKAFNLSEFFKGLDKSETKQAENIFNKYLLNPEDQDIV